MKLDRAIYYYCKRGKNPNMGKIRACCTKCPTWVRDPRRTPRRKGRGVGTGETSVEARREETRATGRERGHGVHSCIVAFLLPCAVYFRCNCNYACKENADNEKG
jgi:hypothetical protein